MAVVSTLAVDLTLRSASFARGLRSAESQLRGFATFTRVAGKQLRGLGVALGVGVGGGLTAAVIRFVTAGIRYGDMLDDMSQRTGIAVKDLTKLERVATVSGVSFDTLASSIQIMQRSISRAGTGDKGLVGLFQSLRLDIGSLRNLNAFSAFEKIARALGKITNEADRIRAIQMIFGRGGGLIAGIIGDPNAIDKATEGMDRFTRSLSEVDIKRMSQIADTLDMLGRAWKSFSIEVTSNTIDAAQISVAILRRFHSLLVGAPDIWEGPRFAKGLTTATGAPPFLRWMMMQQARGGGPVIPKFPSSVADLRSEILGRSSSELGLSAFGRGPIVRDISAAEKARNRPFGNIPRANGMPLLFKENRIEEEQLEVLKDMLEKLRDIDDGLDDTGLN